MIAVLFNILFVYVATFNKSVYKPFDIEQLQLQLANHKAITEYRVIIPISSVKLMYYCSYKLIGDVINQSVFLKNAV